MEEPFSAAPPVPPNLVTASSSKSSHWLTNTYRHCRWKIIGIRPMTADKIVIIHLTARQRRGTFGQAGLRTFQHYHHRRAYRSRGPPIRRRHHTLVILATLRRLRLIHGNPWFMPTNLRNDKNLSLFFSHNRRDISVAI